MRCTKITLSQKYASEKKTNTFNLSFHKDKTIYQIVDYFRNNIFNQIPGIPLKGKREILIKNLITLHNVYGIKNMNEIKSMICDIKKGKDILEEGGLPNTKVFLINDEEYLLFDGHHTILAYLFTGSKYLDEIPHISIEGIAKPEEFLVFFGEHGKKINSNNWKEYVINWNLPKESQLRKRKQNTIGEVFDLLTKSHSS